MRIADHLLTLKDAPARQMKSPNHGGPLVPRFLVMHYTAGRSAESWFAVARASSGSQTSRSRRHDEQPARTL